MTKTVPITNRKDKEQILWFLRKEGQMLPPILWLVETSRIAPDEVDGKGAEVGRGRLFVIDGAKALRKAINDVFGRGSRRCSR